MTEDEDEDVTILLEQFEKVNEINEDVISRCVILSCIIIGTFVTQVVRCVLKSHSFQFIRYHIFSRELKRFSRATFVNYMVVIDCCNALAHIPILLQMLQ